MNVMFKLYKSEFQVIPLSWEKPERTKKTKKKKYKKNRSNVHQIRWILVEYYSPRKILYHKIQPLFLNLAHCMVSLFLNLVHCMMSLFLNLAYCNVLWWHCNSHRCHISLFFSLQQCILINSINLQKKSPSTDTSCKIIAINAHSMSIIVPSR